MCLAVPARIVSFKGTQAIVDVMGVKQNIIISLIDSVNAGDYVLVHAGYAIEKIDSNYYSFLNKALSELNKDN